MKIQTSSPPVSRVEFCIILVNWNCSSLIIDRLKDLSPRHSLIVVDNNSDDWESIEQFVAKSNFDVTLLRLESNLGFGGGMNAGMREAERLGFKYVLLLNPDAFPEPNQLDLMLSRLNEFDVIGIQQVTKISSNHLKPYPCAAVLRRGRFVAIETVDKDFQEVDLVTGAAILLKLDFAKKVGFIDERFFHYKEEFDFTYRMGVSGARVCIVGGAPLIHLSGHSLNHESPMSSYYWVRNEILFLQIVDVVPFFQKVISVAATIISRFKKNGVRHTFAIIQGFAHGIASRGGKF